MSTTSWFSLSVRYGTAASAVACAGTLDAANATRIAEAANIVIDRHSSLLVVDCARVTAASNEGVETLARIARRCRAHGVGFSLVPGDAVRATAESLGIAEPLGLAERVLRIETMDRLARRPRRAPVILTRRSGTAPQPAP
jgi:anti-anti-sigma regulatory factor